MLDKYDAQIQRIITSENPEEVIRFEWGHGIGLFDFCTQDRRAYTPDGRKVGCLTMVRSGLYHAETPELTAAIRADTRIPSDLRGITVDDLPIFADWQRRLDEELQRD